MHAQILVDGEMEVLVSSVTDAVVTVLADLAAELTDPALRTAMETLVVAARGRLTQTPVDPEPLVWAILHGDPLVLPVGVEAAPAVELGAARTDPLGLLAPVDAAKPPNLFAPAYWPAVPPISDELFAQYAAQRPQPGADLEQEPQPADQAQEPQRADPAQKPQPADSVPEATAIDAPGPEREPAHEGRFPTRAIRRQGMSHPQ